jgi:hypothetical protein
VLRSRRSSPRGRGGKSMIGKGEGRGDKKTGQSKRSEEVEEN